VRHLRDAVEEAKLSPRDDPGRSLVDRLDLLDERRRGAAPELR